MKRNRIKNIIISTLVIVLVFSTTILASGRNNIVNECLINSNLELFIKENDVNIRIADKDFKSDYDDYDNYGSYYDNVKNEIVIKATKNDNKLKQEVYYGLGSMIYYNLNCEEKEAFKDIFNKEFANKYEEYKNIKINKVYTLTRSTAFITTYGIYMSDTKWLKDNYLDMYNYFSRLEDNYRDAN